MCPKISMSNAAMWHIKPCQEQRICNSVFTESHLTYITYILSHCISIFPLYVPRQTWQFCHQFLTNKSEGALLTTNLWFKSTFLYIMKTELGRLLDWWPPFFMVIQCVWNVVMKNRAHHPNNTLQQIIYIPHLDRGLIIGIELISI